MKMMQTSSARSRNHCAVYRLIVRRVGGRAELLTVSPGGEEVLPVFSWEDEARMFLEQGGFEEGGWQIVERTAGELASMLAEDRCAGVGSVALDPLPRMADQSLGATIALVSLSRWSFLGLLADAPKLSAR